MPNLTRLSTWQKFAPDLGDNRECPKPFYFEVATGLTKEQVAAFAEALGAATKLENQADLSSRLGELLKPYVRFPDGGESLAVKGKPILDLQAYLALVANIPDGYNMLELVSAVRHANSIEGSREVFYERLSGGFASMPNGRTRTAAH